MIQGVWGWCIGMTQRDGMGRDVRGGFRMGNTCTLMADDGKGWSKISIYKMNAFWESNIQPNDYT